MTFFFENLDYEPIEKFCNACLTTKGVIFFSGVGKSGFIAQKISMTLVSTGTKAVFLNPTDALHGDIGILSEDDLLVMFSKSGSTEELLRLVPYARAKGAKLVSVTSIKGCKLVCRTRVRVARSAGVLSLVNRSLSSQWTNGTRYCHDTVGQTSKLSHIRRRLACPSCGIWNGEKAFHTIGSRAA